MSPSPAGAPGSSPAGPARPRHLRLVGREDRTEPPPGVTGSPQRRGRTGGEPVKTSTIVMVLTAVLCCFGLVEVLSSSAYTSIADYGSPWTIFERQLMWMFLGVTVLALTVRVGYQALRKVRLALPVITLGLLLAVLIPGIGSTVGGSSRWLGAGSIQIQPSELMKLALVVFAADLTARRADQLDRPARLIVPLVVMLTTADILLLAQPDMGTALVLCCITFGLMFASGIRTKVVMELVGVFVIVGLVVSLAAPYRRARLLSFLHPFATRNGDGYQVFQSLVGLGNGGLFGLGLGNGHQKWGLLPNPQTDFIFSVVGEELGAVGAVLLLALFAALAWAGFRTAKRAPDLYGSLLAVACTCWISAQAIINVGAVLAVLPVTGIPLPFISDGGSSLVITLAAVGLLVSVARSAEAAARSTRPAPRSQSTSRSDGRRRVTAESPGGRTVSSAARR